MMLKMIEKKIGQRMSEIELRIVVSNANCKFQIICFVEFEFFDVKLVFLPRVVSYFIVIMLSI